MLDATDYRIVQALVANARISLKELSGQVNLSSPSVAERLRRLEERGVIRSFTVQIDPLALGYQLQAMVRVRPLPGKLHLVQEQLEAIPEICECDKVTGEDCFIARMYVRSIEQLDEILDRVADKAETNTSIIKSQPIPRRLPPLLSPESERLQTAPRPRRSRQPARTTATRRQRRRAGRSS